MTDQMVDGDGGGADCGRGPRGNAVGDSCDDGGGDCGGSGGGGDVNGNGGGHGGDGVVVIVVMVIVVMVMMAVDGGDTVDEIVCVSVVLRSCST